MTYAARSGGVKFLHSVVKNFMYLSTVTSLCEVEFHLCQVTHKQLIMQKVSE